MEPEIDGRYRDNKIDERRKKGYHSEANQHIHSLIHFVFLFICFCSKTDFICLPVALYLKTGLTFVSLGVSRKFHISLMKAACSFSAICRLWEENCNSTHPIIPELFSLLLVSGSSYSLIPCDALPACFGHGYQPG